MKAIIAFSLLVVGIAAYPQTSLNPIVHALHQNDERLVTGSIIKAIEAAAQTIKDAGYDPVYIDNISLDYELPVPVLFSIQALIEELIFQGISDIVVQSMNYSIITNRLTFDIRLPLIEFTLGKASSEVTLFGSSSSFYASGRVAIVGVQLTGNIRISIGIISGISIRSMDLKFLLGGIESDLTVQTLGKDFTEPINRFLGTTIPAKLTEYSSEINELLVIVATEIAEGIL